MYSLAETPQHPSSRIWAPKRERYWSAKDRRHLFGTAKTADLVYFILIYNRKVLKRKAMHSPALESADHAVIQIGRHNHAVARRIRQLGALGGNALGH